MIEFDYRRERLRTGETIFRPVAKVYLLRQEGEWVAEYFYVDSGADYTLIPYRMGRFLGLEKIASEIREMGGIERVPFLLGREGVFDHFDVTFQQRSKKTIFVWQG
ncbi:MAG: hypothetical protein ACE5I2_08460 [Anaerolineae bacterium]